MGCAMTDLDRLMKSPHFRWMPGMRDDSGRRVNCPGHYPSGVNDGDDRMRPNVSALAHDARPDIEDHATKGCLLALARESWGDPALSAAWVVARDGGLLWLICSRSSYVVDGYHDTEAEAIIAAILSAPEAT